MPGLGTLFVIWIKSKKQSVHPELTVSLNYSSYITVSSYIRTGYWKVKPCIVSSPVQILTCALIIQQECMSHILSMRWFITLYCSVGYVVSVELTPLCHKQTRNEGPVSLFKVIISPPWLALTIFLPSSLFLFVAHWQCYLLPVIALSFWLHILIAVYTAFINHFSCSSIQPFSHQFTYFLIWWFFFTIFSSSCRVVQLLMFFPALLTNRKMCVFSCTVSHSYHGADSRGRSTLSQIHHWQVSTLAVCIYQESCCVCLFIDVSALLSGYEVELCCRWRTLLIYLV